MSAIYAPCATKREIKLIDCKARRRIMRAVCGERISMDGIFRVYCHKYCRFEPQNKYRGIKRMVKYYTKLLESEGYLVHTLEPTD
jgi:hypothetical protein